MGLLLRWFWPTLFHESARRRRTTRACAGERRSWNYGFGAGEAISPDGKRLIFNADVNAPDSPQGVVSKLALVTLDSSSQSSPLLIQPDPRIATAGFTDTMTFTPDGKSVAYIIRNRGVDNIFVQPLDGSPGRQITNFTSENIAQFQWSPDGKALAVARSHNTSDVVLLRESRRYQLLRPRRTHR